MVAEHEHVAIPRNTVLQGHSLDLLRQLPDGCVQTIVTSPPYMNLRSYGTPPQIWGGVSTCIHEWETPRVTPPRNRQHLIELGERLGCGGGTKHSADATKFTQTNGSMCQHCDAWLGELGSEPSLDRYLDHLVSIFRECWRVLRDDGTLWINLGDGYSNDTKWGGGSAPVKNTTSAAGGYRGQRERRSTGLPPKSLMLIPARFAIAMLDDGWTLRSDIIWKKTNGLPEAVTDRPTMNYEHLFLFSKRARYFYDAEAIKEPVTGNAHQRGHGVTPKSAPSGGSIRANASYHAAITELVDARNARAVWDIPTESFAGAHFATFPQALAARCVAAGSSPRACERCGAPWKRVVTKGSPAPEPAHRAPLKRLKPGQAGNAANGNMGFRASKLSGQEQARWRADHPDTQTGWAHTCTCPNTSGHGRSLVLDPFSGAATVALVARRLGRDYLGMELNAAYIALGDERLQRDLLPPAMKHTALALIPATLWDDPPG